jgi:hypothetical protein
MQQAPPTSPFVPMLHMTAQNMKALIRIHEKQEEEIESDSHSISLKLNVGVFLEEPTQWNNVKYVSLVLEFERSIYLHSSF